MWVTPLICTLIKKDDEECEVVRLKFTASLTHHTSVLPLSS